MPRQEPLYPHVTKSKMSKRDLPLFLEDSLTKASDNIADVIAFFRVQRGYLEGLDPTVKKFIDSLKEMDSDLIKKRVWIKAYRTPPGLKNK